MILQHASRTPAPQFVPGLTTLCLPRGSQLFVWSARTWQRTQQDPTLPSVLLDTPYRHAGCPRAAGLLREQMALLHSAAVRPFVSPDLYTRRICVDEANLLRALRALSRADAGQAAAVLSDYFCPDLTRIYLRVAAEYVRELTGAGMPVRARAHLRLASGQPC